MFDNITPNGAPAYSISIEEIRATEARWKFRFPAGYDEYMTRFGEGVMGGFLVRIFPPYRLNDPAGSVADWREWMRGYWFWEADENVLTKRQVLEAVVIGDTLNGDMLFVLPDDPDLIYVVPHESDKIYLAGRGLPAALEWLCTSDVVTEPFSDRIFEPRDYRGIDDEYVDESGRVP